MSKKWVIVGGVVLAGIVGGILFFSYSKKSANLETSNATDNFLATTPKSTFNLDTSYKDDLGLTFKFPSDATVTDITPNDNSYYTLLDIRRGDKSIRITIKDGEFTLPTDASLVGAATLGKFSAKQYAYKSKGDDTLATVAVNQGIVYLVEGPKDGSNWEDLQNAIVGSVNFGTQQAATTSGGSDTSTVDEGEETVE